MEMESHHTGLVPRANSQMMSMQWRMSMQSPIFRWKFEHDIFVAGTGVLFVVSARTNKRHHHHTFFRA
jgi:hypothetical protein